jgi:hypothetical protein
VSLMMNPSLINGIVAGVGVALVALGRSGLLAEPWAGLALTLGGLLGGASAFPRAGDVALHELPKEIQDSVRPSKAP